jgi:hypothetical protein
MAGDTLDITHNFLYCIHQVHIDFLITLYLWYVLHFHITLFVISAIIHIFPVWEQQTLLGKKSQCELKPPKCCD